MMFEYDPEKLEKVFKKRDLDLRRMTDVFDDPFHLIEDSQQGKPEKRKKAIGYSETYCDIVVLIFMYIDGGKRLVTGWPANKSTKNKYNRNKQGLGG